MVFKLNWFSVRIGQKQELPSCALPKFNVEEVVHMNNAVSETIVLGMKEEGGISELFPFVNGGIDEIERRAMEILRGNESEPTPEHLYLLDSQCDTKQLAFTASYSFEEADLFGIPATDHLIWFTMSKINAIVIDFTE